MIPCDDGGTILFMWGRGKEPAIIEKRTLFELEKIRFDGHEARGGRP